MADESSSKGDQQQGGGDAARKMRRTGMRTGFALGIGSAAIAAALLYANRSRRSGDRGGND